MLINFIGRADGSFPRWVALAGSVTVACSFYTANPYANPGTGQPKNPAAAGSNGLAGGGNAGGGGMSGTASSTGGVGTTDAGAAGAGPESGSGGMTQEPASWVRATGNLAGKSAACGNVIFMSVKPDEDLVILAVQQDGLWGSRDGGGSWQPLGTGSKSVLIANTPTDLVYDPDHPDTFWEAGIYGGPGVYRSDDDGDTFQALGMVTHNEFLSVDFGDPDRQLMLTGGHEQGATLYRSVNGGADWEQIGGAIPDGCMHSSYPLVLDADTYLLGCRNRILKSFDAGQTWDIANGFGGENQPLVTAGGVIYWAIQNNAGLVRSSDGGDTWERVVGGGVISNTHPLELPDGSLAAASGNKILRSTDEGVTWQPVTPELTFTPSGFVYSAQQHAFFVWQSTCENQVPKDAVMRLEIAF
jgi:hypothetical protein